MGKHATAQGHRRCRRSPILRTDRPTGRPSPTKDTSCQNCPVPVLHGPTGWRSGEPIAWGPLLIVPPLPAAKAADPAKPPPIRAWKLAGGIRLSEGHWRFLPLSSGHAGYSSLDRARCDAPTVGHRAPGRACTCGFYALAEVLAADAASSISGSRVLLEVDLYGHILLGEHGFRTERQWVRRVIFPRCVRGGHRCAGSVAPCVVDRYSGEAGLVALCEACADREHALSFVEAVRPISSAEATGLLGAPVLILANAVRELGTEALLFGGPPSAGRHFLFSIDPILSPMPGGTVPGDGERLLVRLAEKAGCPALLGVDPRPPPPTGDHREALRQFLALPQMLTDMARRIERLERGGAASGGEGPSRHPSKQMARGTGVTRRATPGARR